MVRLTEHKPGQHLLLPVYPLEGWWTRLREAPERVIRRYQRHGTHQQFHAEGKTDLDLERLPSGKCDGNDLILHLRMLAYNCLRLLGQRGLTGMFAPVRHPVQRRRLKTVLQEILYRVAQFIRKARQRWLDFGRTGSIAAVFAALQEEVLTAGQSP